MFRTEVPVLAFSAWQVFEGKKGLPEDRIFGI